MLPDQDDLPQRNQALLASYAHLIGRSRLWEGFDGPAACCCRLPEDVEQLERLNSAMSNLTTDNDRETSFAARNINDIFKHTPVS